MMPEDKIEIITDFLNHFIDKLNQEVIDKLEGNFNQGEDLLRDYEKEGIQRILYTKQRLESWLIDDEELYNYVYEED
ncbi:hypothetical protein [Peptostreptococcus porci]|uniref:hypothetical protein n=1 Tax=Peptostreptococcus porci TaxID=2652282 RepID=UPI002A7EE0B2|nr:hypothetical protein [Peptostreptococcus porci]MDY4127698.1 hypothetical protein [Peptostreptococcus porci]